MVAGDSSCNPLVMGAGGEEEVEETEEAEDDEGEGEATCSLVSDACCLSVVNCKYPLIDAND